MFVCSHNEVAYSQECDILSSWSRAQSTWSSSTLQPFSYIMSPNIWRTMVCSTLLEIFFTAFSANAFLTCHGHKYFLASGHTMLRRQHTSENGVRWRTIYEELVSHIEKLLCYSNTGCMTLKDCFVTMKNINIELKKKNKPMKTTPKSLPHCINFSLCIVNDNRWWIPIWFDALNLVM